MPKFQSYARLPQPVNVSGSYVVLKTGRPKFRLLLWPQKSPPDARRSCVCGFSRSQSGRQFVFASVHVRFAVVETRESGLSRPPVIELPSAAARYFPAFTLIAVLPLPNRSYAAPRRGVMSSYDTPSDGSYTIATGTNGFGPSCCRGKWLHTWSYRSPPDNVSRFIVH